MFNLGGVEALAKTVWAFGKKNRSSFMVGGSIVLSWVSLISMMIEAPKAAKCVESENQKRKKDDLEEMTKSEIAIIYARNCWPSFTAMAGSNTLEICAHKDLLNDVGQLYMLSQLYKKDGDKLKNQILKEEDGEKKLKEYQDKAYEEDHPIEKIAESSVYKNLGENETLIEDVTTERQFSSTMTNLRDGVSKFNQMMYDRYVAAYKNKYGEQLKDAFYGREGNPFPIEDDNIYVTAKYDEFLACIGEIKGPNPVTELGQVFEFHYDGRGPAVDFNKVVEFKDYVDQKTGHVVFARIRSLLQEELIFACDSIINTYDWVPSKR